MAERPMYTNHKDMNISDVIVLMHLGPPSSPPDTDWLRRSNRMPMAIMASVQKMVTENPKLQKNRDKKGVTGNANCTLMGPGIPIH